MMNGQYKITNTENTGCYTSPALFENVLLLVVSNVVSVVVPDFDRGV